MKKLISLFYIFLLFFWGGAGGGGSDPLCLPSSLALHFSDYSFWVHHLVSRDDRHLLANAMASDYSVAWQCLSKRTIVFLLWIKLYAYIFSLKQYILCVFVKILPLSIEDFTSTFM
jgi:hypothetical protein